MPQYERGHSGPEIGEMQQRLADLGFEVTPTNEFDEYTEEALRRYQSDWLYAEGSGVADEETLTRLEDHHSNRDPGTIGGPQFSEGPTYDSGADTYQVSPSGEHWWDGEQWVPFIGPPVVDPVVDDGMINPFANPTPQIDSETLTNVGQAVSGAYEEVKREAGELWDGVVDEASKIISGEEPLPDVRN